MVSWVEEIESIYAFTEILVETYRVCLPALEAPFPHFFDQAYAAYLAAMIRPDYYLSDLGLLALSHCAQISVVIFRHCLETQTLSVFLNSFSFLFFPKQRGTSKGSI